MNLKFLMGFLIYYALLAAIFNFGGVYLGGASTTAQYQAYNPNVSIDTINDTNTSSYSVGSSEVGITQFGALKRLVSTAGFMFFGIGLPSDTPPVFAWMFALIFTCISILAAFVVLSGLWNG